MALLAGLTVGGCDGCGRPGDDDDVGGEGEGEGECAEEAAMQCSGDVIEECVDGSWQLMQDCLYLCGGTCAVDTTDGPVCLC